MHAIVHAQRALDLAAANGQPPRSAIYFGVDGADLHLNDLVQEGRRRGGKPVSDQEIQEIKKLRKAKEPLTLARRYNAFLKYRDEAFGANARITAVTAEGRKNPEYARFVDQNRWNLLQQRETPCDKWRSKGVSFDFNRVGPQAEFGAWSIKQPEVIPVARPETCRSR